MTNVVGIVEEVINNGKAKGSGIRINGLKYGVYDPASANLDQISTGITVSLRFKETEKSGITYRNVQGIITPVKDGTPLVAAPATESGSIAQPASKTAYRRNGEEGGFPIHARAYERALDRRNALQVAATMGLKKVEDVLKAAREFEAYTTGDDITNAENTLAFLNDDLTEE